MLSQIKRRENRFKKKKDYASSVVKAILSEIVPKEVVLYAKEIIMQAYMKKEFRGQKQA